MAKEYPCVKKVKEIDRRVPGPSGKTKSGKRIRNPRAYVFGGMRRQGWKPRSQRRKRRGLASKAMRGY